MQQYVRASFKDLHAMSKAVVPALELEVEITLSRTSPGESIAFPENYLQIWIDTVQGFLFWGTATGDIASEYVATGFPGPLFYSPGLREDSQALDCSIVFPLSSDTVSRIESLRAGHDASFRAYLRLSGYVQATQGHLTNPPGSRGDTPVTMSHVSFDTAGIPFHVNRLHLTDRGGTHQPIRIPKSRWAEDVLPGLGWGVSKIVELRLVGAEDTLKDTDKLLDEAQRKFAEGDWTGSLTASRKAMESLQPIVKEHINPAHADRAKSTTAGDKAEALGQTFEELARSMLSYQGAVRGLLHAGAHQPVPGATLERADAELGLTLTLGVRRYIGTRMPPIKTP